MMRYLKFVLPFVLIAAMDVTFQHGLWEPIASPESHAGMSITKKIALESPAFQHIDFVTLGSSRPVYGLDHEMLAEAFSEQSYTYANLSVPGTHWMSIGVIATWLARHHPEIRGGVIGLSVQDFIAPGNGTYEIGIAYPFHTYADIPQMMQHVPFDWHDPATYGLYSALFEYHEDVQNLLAHPDHRDMLLQFFRGLTPKQVLAGNADESTDMCKAPVMSLNDCANPNTQADKRIGPQCRQLQESAAGRYDLRPFLEGKPLADTLQRTRDLIRDQLRALPWPTPPVVILMPVPSVWSKDVMPSGAHEWALSVLEPLIAEGKIHLLDYTDLFDGNGEPECKSFFDLYHNNVAGRRQLMEIAMPQMERMLFARTATSSQQPVAMESRK